MMITDYHVQSVLRTYSRQLLRARFPSAADQGGRSLPAVKVVISEEAQQRLLMDRIKSQAVEQLHQQLGMTKD
jgi:hypothetical protein